MIIDKGKMGFFKAKLFFSVLSTVELNLIKSKVSFIRESAFGSTRTHTNGTKIRKWKNEKHFV